MPRQPRALGFASFAGAAAAVAAAAPSEGAAVAAAQEAAGSASPPLPAAAARDVAVGVHPVKAVTTSQSRGRQIAFIMCLQDMAYTVPTHGQGGGSGKIAEGLPVLSAKNYGVQGVGTSSLTPAHNRQESPLVCWNAMHDNQRRNVGKACTLCASNSVH